MRRLLAWAAICALGAGSAEAAGSFVYVPVLPCEAGPACAPEVLVYDAITSGFVTRIPLAPNSTIGSFLLSYDGGRLFVITVSQGNSTLNVIDTSRHAVTSIYPGVGGILAVSADPNTLFVLQGLSGIAIFDLRIGRVVRTIPVDQTSANFYGFVVTPSGDRAYLSGPGFSPTSVVRSYDLTTGQASIMSSALFYVVGLKISRDGSRLYESWAFSSGAHPSDPSRVDVLDTATNNVLYSRNVDFLQISRAVGVESFRGTRTYIWDDFSVGVVDANTGAVLDSIPTPNPFLIGVAISADDTRGWMAMTSLTTPDFVDFGSHNRLAVFDTTTNQLIGTVALPGPPLALAATPPGAPACSYHVSTHQSSWSVNAGSTAIALKTACPWEASSDASWARIDATSGTGDAAITLTVDKNFTTTNRSATLTIGGQIVNVTQASFSATAPFGSFDTPFNNSSGLSGAIAVTGWALDDVGVTRVRIYRDPVSGEVPGQLVYIGDGVFVDGARPDVQTVYPSFPNASRAGWGLQVLTNALPGQGNGTYRLTVFADDVEGHSTMLGTASITCANTTATAPFGTIDTPAQGEVVSGSVVDYGWALAPPPKVIPFDGSTIDVLVDGILVGHPAYGLPRTDIDTLFPGYQNTEHAVGFFVLDTTTLTNGMHTIAWIVRDNTGATQGIGSRFFTVANP